MSSRTPTAVDAIAETHLAAAVQLDPLAATSLGIPGHDHRLPEYTPDWWASVAQERGRSLAALASATATDETDRITVAAMRSSLGVAQELHAAGTDEGRLNVLESPLQAVRTAFDLMPTASADDWATIATRLAAVPSSIDGYVASLRFAAARGTVAARRQVSACAEQCADNAGPDGFFAAFASSARTADGSPLPAGLQADLDRAAVAAGDAYGSLDSVLRDELLPAAPERDACGRDLYALHSRSFLGAVIDLEETYHWGQQELAAVNAEIAATADRILPGATRDDAIAHLDGDPRRLLHGTDALQRWMQETSDAAVTALADVHFDIPDAIRTLECRIAPTQSGSIYYTGPSEDLVTRPGRMWWSVPKGVTSFTPWRERTTVYHEGVPGHHLQVAQTVYRRDLLNSWRRLASWVSGHGEGWALYAERLMADLGFLDDPADFLGMLDGQSMRAARVVVDIGVHCGFQAPASVGGGAWTYDKAWTFLRANTTLPEAMLRFELNRYLGWPGQAPSYKIGERLWLQLRDRARAAEGADFDLKAFHRRALDMGSVGLDVLADAL